MNNVEFNKLENRLDSVPYIVFESEMARMERHTKRLWMVILTMLFMFITIIGIFIWYLNQYDFVNSESVVVDGADGIANYIGNDGSIMYGTDSNQTDAQTYKEIWK